MISTPIEKHPERNVIRLELRQNTVLKEMTDGEREELEPHLVIVDCSKGDELKSFGSRRVTSGIGQAPPYVRSHGGRPAVTLSRQDADRRIHKFR